MNKFSGFIDNRKINNLLLLIFLVGLFSCAEEDPNLVNPPLPNETVRIRFFNFAQEPISRKLDVSGKLTASTPYGELSPELVPPPTDSVIFQSIIGLDNRVEFTDSNKTRLWRDSDYIIFGLSKPGSSTLDTLVTTLTSFSFLRDTSNCFLSIININKSDESAAYTLVEGCPNGPMAFAPVNYTAKSSEIEITAGKVPFSIIKMAGNSRTSLGLFEFELQRKGEYLLIITGDNAEDFKLVNRRDHSPAPIRNVKLITSTTAQIRTANFSSEQISALRFPDETFLGSLAPGSISSFQDVTACESDYLDSIIIKSNGNFASSVRTPLVINDKYNLIIMDSASGKASRSFIVKTLNYFERANRAVVRVVHYSEKLQMFNMSMGAREDESSTTGYITGESLAKNLNYGMISGPAYVLPGKAPITLYSATSPQRLLGAFIGEFEANHSYLVIVSNNSSGSVRISILDEHGADLPVSFNEEGAYVQIGHLVPEVDELNFSIDNILPNVKLFFQNSLATVLPVGTIRISSTNSELTINTSTKTRDILVFAGEKNKIDILYVQSQPLAYNPGAFQRRFINAAKDVNLLKIFDNDPIKFPTLPPIVTDLSYGSVSEPSAVFLDRRFSYFFYNQTNEELLKQINDISMSFGKNYTVVFGGNNKILSNKPITYNYNIIIFQEY